MPSQTAMIDAPRTATATAAPPGSPCPASIRYAIVAETTGFVLVAATDLGLCAILFGTSDSELRNDLRQRFPDALLHPTETGSDDRLAAAYRAIADGRSVDHLTLDLRGSDFQRQVWTALRKIPAGTTASYTEIARRIGRPKAVRAVARACAANPLAVAVPCHRVVGSDGSLGGYRWGAARKRALLRGEGVRCPM